MELYIQRQIEFEKAHGVVVNPTDMTNLCPPEEASKVKIYRKTFGFNNQVRNYSKNRSGKWIQVSKQTIY